MGWGGILRDFLCYTRSAKPKGLEEGGKGGGGSDQDPSPSLWICHQVL